MVGVKTAGKRRSLLMSDMACRGSGPAHACHVAIMICNTVSGYSALCQGITHCTRLSCTVQGIMQCQPQMQLSSDSSCSCSEHQQTDSILHRTLAFADLELLCTS